MHVDSITRKLENCSKLLSDRSEACFLLHVQVVFKLKLKECGTLVILMFLDVLHVQVDKLKECGTLVVTCNT